MSRRSTFPILPERDPYGYAKKKLPAHAPDKASWSIVPFIGDGTLLRLNRNTIEAR